MQRSASSRSRWPCCSSYGVLTPSFASLILFGCLFKTMNERKRVLILCTGNSARSQIAEAILRHVSEFEVHSAGVEPTAVKLEVKRVLDEIGVGSDGLRSKSVDEFAGQEFDHI